MREELEMITTGSGTYTYEELKKRDNMIIQMFIDFWEGKMEVMELHKKKEEMLKNGKITHGELDSLQYYASRVHDNLKKQEMQN
jgi:hypothetical protein